MSRLWDKGAPLDQRVLRFTAGEDHALDNRLVAYDVVASIAHAEMLHDSGLLDAGELDAIRKGLREIAAAHARGEWTVTLELEDGQTALETLLTQKIGMAGARLHAGRSRNDQVLAALRLYLRDAIEAVADGARGVIGALERLVAEQGGVALPGYTHMQQAMPSSVALWAGGFAAELHDDVVALRHAHRRIGKNPLGSAAGYGTPNLPVNRDGTRTRLDWPENHEPVTAVQLSRGKGEAEILFQVTLLMQDLGRLASDLLLFYTREFGFVQLPDAFTTGSSIMPQKRNPDVFELVRGRTATAQASLVEVLGITAKLPSGYQRDLQLIKAPLFRSIDICLESLDVMAAAIPSVRFQPQRIRLDDDIHAAAEANALVASEGIPFREAYRRIGAKYSKRD
ncbi:MAG TPA: argininosuccinate lyase [Steroidobacteraceae bacterium]|nr:argininosuccinate lyase [Steroidobacteraceae bacterium]